VTVEHPRNELVLTLAQLGALVLKQLPPGSPGQHQKRNNAGHQEWAHREPHAGEDRCTVELCERGAARHFGGAEFDCTERKQENAQLFSEEETCSCD